MSAPSFPGPAPAWQLWRNPILRRYLRTRLRPRALGASLIILILLAGFIFTLSRTIGMSQLSYHNDLAARMIAAGKPVPPGLTLDLASVERICLLPLLALQGFILFVVGTAQVAGGMTSEAEEGTMDYLRLSPMTPLAKVLGYLLGLPIREWLLFAVTLPFTAWGLWHGKVPVSNWFPVYAVVLSAALLYHITGLTAGTVLRNRRWTFLVSVGGIFILYTLIPQLANLGLVYFEYLTIMPVVMENLPGFLPLTAGAAMQTVQQLQPDVRFFGLGFPEAVFTIFSQLVLCLTFAVMLWRRWRRSESHLLGKPWASGLAVWIQIVLLGCSLPLVSPGLLFISRRISMRFGRVFSGNSNPELPEAAAMIAVFGTVTLLAILILAICISPSRESQQTGLRRATKANRRIPFFSDEASALPFTVVMALAGAAGWTIFAQKLVGSHWFPGQSLPASTPLIFAAVLLSTSLCSVLLYELRGAKGLFLAGIFAGIVPLLAGTILIAANRDLSASAVWVTALSPLSTPTNAVATLLPDATFRHTGVQLAAPRAFLFWQALLILATLWLWSKHRTESKARRSTTTNPTS